MKSVKKALCFCMIICLSMCVSVVALAKPEDNTVKITVEGEGFSLITEEMKPIPEKFEKGKDLMFAMVMSPGYVADKEDFEVNINDVKITSSNGLYTVKNVKEDLVITVKGIITEEEAKEPKGKLVKTIVMSAFIITLVGTVWYVMYANKKAGKKK